MNIQKDEKTLFDILDSALAAAKHTKGVSEEEFQESSLIQDAVAMRLSAMGEATHKVSESTQQTLTEIPFRKIRSMRNIIAHSYKSVNTAIVWDVVKNHLPNVIHELTNHLALNTNFEELTALVHSGPPLDLIAAAAQKGSALNLVTQRAIELKIDSAKEFKDTVDAFTPPSGGGVPKDRTPRA